MNESNTIQGIVLKRRDFMESDRMITLFTKQEGVIEIIAKGARKAGSKLAAASEPLFTGSFYIAKGKKNGYLTQFEPGVSYSKLRQDYDILTHTFSLLEIFSAVSIPGSIAPKCYDLLEEALNLLIENIPVLNVNLWTCVHLLELEGISPSWIQCISSKNILSEDPAWFSTSFGGYISRGYEKEYKDRMVIPAKALITFFKLGKENSPPQKIKDAEICWYYLAQIWKTHAHKRMPATESSMNACKKAFPHP